MATQLGDGVEYESMEAANEIPRPKRRPRRLLAAVMGGALLVYAATTMGGAIGIPPLELAKTVSMPHTGEWCSGSGAATYTKKTLKTVAERPVSGLLTYTKSSAENKYEASDVIRVGNQFYVVCDSSWSILRFEHSLPLLSSDNEAIQPTFEPPDDGDSGFEAIMHDATSEGDFYVIRESLQHEVTGNYHAYILKVHIGESGETYDVVETCRSEIAFEGDSKGFEGATSLRGADGTLYLLGLCEGNFCSETRGKEVGNGRVIVMAREDDADDGCIWKTVKTLELPKAVQFVDYSAFAVHHSTMAVAVTSQENSQLWVGSLVGGADGKFEPATASFGEGKIFDFPRTSHACDVQYCNIEGVHWVSGQDSDKAPQMLVAVSDKMKSKGRQASTCFDKDQSVHLFTLP